MLKTLLLVLSFCLYGPLLAADSDLEAAARFYQRGEFDRAIALYEKRLSNEPANASLYHNLGLSYYRNGQLGPAIAAYLQAAQLQPGEPDIRYNLEFLLKQTQDKLDARLNRNWFDGLSLLQPVFVPLDGVGESGGPCLPKTMVMVLRFSHSLWRSG
jgi:tetratricopeptide (TPR) repeat protein